MSTESPRPRLASGPQAAVGLIVVVWGLALTFANLGWFDPHWLRSVFGFWPMILVAVGLAKMLSAGRGPGRVVGAALLGFGLLVMAERAFFFHVSIWDFWPLALVGIGLMLIMRARDGRPFAPASSVRVTAGGAELAFVSGLERRVAAQDYTGSNLNVIMGAINLDLRGAQMAGDEAVVDLFVLMGGVELIVPPDWAVVNRITPIVGGVEDRSTGTKDGRHRLVVQGTVIMGGVEIKT